MFLYTKNIPLTELTSNNIKPYYETIPLLSFNLACFLLYQQCLKHHELFKVKEELFQTIPELYMPMRFH